MCGTKALNIAEVETEVKLDKFEEDLSGALFITKQKATWKKLHKSKPSSLGNHSGWTDFKL